MICMRDRRRGSSARWGTSFAGADRPQYNRGLWQNQDREDSGIIHGPSIILIIRGSPVISKIAKSDLQLTLGSESLATASDNE